MGAGRGQIRRRDQVIARTGKQVQSLSAHVLGILQHVRNLGASAFLDAAAGLVFQRGDAAGFVAGARVFVDHLTVTDKIVLEAVDHPHRLVENLLAFAAGKQNVFRAEHLGHLGQDGASAQSHQAV